MKLKMEQTKIQERIRPTKTSHCTAVFRLSSTGLLHSTDGIECGGCIGWSIFEEINQLHNYPIYVE